MRDFTLKKYAQLLKALQSRGFFFVNFEQHVQGPKNKFVLLRHDVDNLPANSFTTAKIEQELGIKGTYYFREVPMSFDENVIKQIADLGHEIGYHYENLSRTMKDEGRRMNFGTMNDEDRTKNEKNGAGKIPSWLLERAIEDFRVNLEKFRRIYPVKTICMHGSPLSKYDNRLLWEKYDYRDFGIIGEPYFDVDFNEVLYLTDTGRRWDGDSFSVRDKVGILEEKNGRMEVRKDGRYSIDDLRLSIDDLRLTNGKNKTLNEKLGLRFRGTQDIIDAAYAGLLPDRIMITVHPQRWSDTLIPWIKELILQNCKNIVKWGIVKVRD